MPKEGESTAPKKARKSRNPSKLSKLRSEHKVLVKKLRKELKQAERDLRSLYPKK
jgi:hypothetical protein